LLGSATIGPVTQSDRGSITALLYREVNVILPVNTRTIEVQIEMDRFQGSFNNGYADNLSLSLTAVPEPSSIALMGFAAVCGLADSGRRKIWRQTVLKTSLK
jgi:hypothetical protein